MLMQHSLVSDTIYGGFLTSVLRGRGSPAQEELFGLLQGWYLQGIPGCILLSTYTFTSKLLTEEQTHHLLAHRARWTKR